MLNYLIQLLLGITLRSGLQPKAESMRVDARCWASYYRGAWSPGYTTSGGQLTLPVTEGTIATTEFGITPSVVEVSLTGILQEREAEYIIGGPISEDTEQGRRMTKRAKTHLQYVPEKGGFRMKKPSIFMDMGCLARAVDMLLPRSIDRDRIVPGPLRLLDTKPNSMIVMITKKGTPTFRQLCHKHGVDYKSVARRFPKDAWNVPLGGRKRVRMLVLSGNPDGSHDGNFYLKKNASFKDLCLYRGMGHHDGKAFLLKGRGIVADHLILRDDIDGITTQDNIKWNDVPVGSVIELDLVPATDETGHAKDGGYGWHSMAMLFMDQTRKQAGAMRRAFQGHIERLNDKFVWKTSREGFMAGLHEFDPEDTDDYKIVQSDLAKHVLGIASESERADIWKNHFQGVVTMKTKISKYPAIIFATEWNGREIKPAHPRYNKAMGDWVRENKLFGAPLTMLRYPVASKGSYLAIQLDAHNEISLADGDPLVVAHPRCAAHLQGDGDDHVLITADWQTGFSPDNEPIQSRSYEKDEPGSTLESLLQVWQASKGIGLIFNSMAKSVGYMHQLSRTQEEIDAEMAWFGGQLDLYAQAVKKPYTLTSPGEIVARAQDWEEEAAGSIDENGICMEALLGRIVGLNMRKDGASETLSELVHEFYGVTLAPELEPNNIPVSELRKLKHRDESIAKKFVVSAGRVRNGYEAGGWHAGLVEALTKGDALEMLSVKRTAVFLDTYAAVAFKIASFLEQEENEAFSMCLERMNGNWVAATQVVRGYLA